MSDESEGKGFKFPGVFEITAMGPAAASLELGRQLVAHQTRVLAEVLAEIREFAFPELTRP